MLHKILRVTLRTTPCMMLRMMPCVTVPLAHDAVQPRSPNLSCPFLSPTSLVHICVRKKAGEFSCRSALGILLFRLHVAIFELRCESALSEPYFHLKSQVAIFQLELRERSSYAAVARKHLRLGSRSWSCCGNALRVQLWPEPWALREPLALKSFDFAAGAR